MNKNRGTKTTNDVLDLLIDAGSHGMTSLELHDFSPRAQARIGELQQDGHEITTTREPNGIARYTYMSTGDPQGHQGGFDIRLRGRTAWVTAIRPARHQTSPLTDLQQTEIANRIAELVESYLPEPEPEPVPTPDDGILAWLRSI